MKWVFGDQEEEMRLGTMHRTPMGVRHEERTEMISTEKAAEYHWKESILEWSERSNFHKGSERTREGGLY